jgi:hypothetical protein
MPYQSRLLANDKGGNEMAFALQLRKSPSKRPSDEGCANNRRFKWGPLPPDEICRNGKGSK